MHFDRIAIHLNLMNHLMRIVDLVVMFPVRLRRECSSIVVCIPKLFNLIELNLWKHFSSLSERNTGFCVNDILHASPIFTKTFFTRFFKKFTKTSSQTGRGCHGKPAHRYWYVNISTKCPYIYRFNTFSKTAFPTLNEKLPFRGSKL